MTVEDTMNHHLRRFDSEEDAVREPTKQRSTDVTVNLRICEWVLLDSGHAFIECPLKLQRKAFALLPIPPVNVLNVWSAAGLRRALTRLRSANREPPASFVLPSDLTDTRLDGDPTRAAERQ